MQKFFKSLADRAANPKNLSPDSIRYAGLNIRLITNMIDMLLLFLLTIPILFFIDKPQFGALPADTPTEVVNIFNMQANGQITNDEFRQRLVATGYIQQKILPKLIAYTFINFLVVGVIFVGCWKYFNSSPGKMLFRIKIVDEKTFKNPTTGQYILRFFGYIISMIPLFVGFLMIAFNRKKKGLHDIIAGTVVIYREKLNPEWEKKKIKYQAYFMLAVLILGAIYLSGKL